jgi:hypothetical protein
MSSPRTHCSGVTAIDFCRTSPPSRVTLILNPNSFITCSCSCSPVSSVSVFQYVSVSVFQCFSFSAFQRFDVEQEQEHEEQPSPTSDL